MKRIILLFCLVGISHQRQISFECKESQVHGAENATEICSVHHAFDLRGVYELIEKSSPSKTVSELNFKNSSIMAVPRKVFIKFRKLQKMDGCNVDFRVLGRDDFIEAHEMIELLLCGNLIQELPDGIFSPMKKLQRVDLSRNFISSLSEMTFVGCSEVLKFLDLSSNKLHELDYTTLVPVAHRKKSPLVLKLDRNSIKTVKESHRVHHLYFEQLYLDGNFLHHFSCPDIRIKELHINDNQLQTTSFDNCSIEYLVASSNELTWLHVHGDMKGLIASKNKIESFVVSGESEMYHLELTQNGEIENIFPSLKLMGDLQYLNLSNSIIGVLHEDTFARMTELKYLFVHNSGIQVIIFLTKIKFSIEFSVQIFYSLLNIY